MPQIDNLIGAKSFELVRDRIAQVLAAEITNQSILPDSTLQNSPVYIERFVPFSDTEMPAVNVMLARGDYNMYTAVTQDGTYQYNIDVYHKSKTTPDGRGDMLATKKLQQLVGVVQTILSHHRYRTLGFAPPFIERVEVKDIKFADPVNSKDSNSVVMARVMFTVRVPESISPDAAVLLDGYDTYVMIANSFDGYVFSGVGTTPPAPTCAPGELRDENGVVLREVPSGGFVVLQNNVITNSDNTYTVELLPEQPLELPDITVTDSNGDEITVPAQTDFVCTSVSPATYDLVNTNGAELLSGLIPSGENAEITAPNGIVHIKKENDVTISNVQAPSGETVNFVVQNNDITVNGANDFEIHAETDLDIRLRDENGDVVVPVSVTHHGNQNHVDIVIDVENPIDVKINSITVANDATTDVNLTLKDQNGDDVPFSQSGTELEVEMPEASVTRSTASILRTGQTVSLISGDDGDDPTGRGANFFILNEIPLMNDGSPTINITTKRFTDTLGGQTYANNIVIDWSTFNGNTVLGYHRTALIMTTLRTLAQAISDAQAFSVSGFSGFKIPNRRELENILYYGGASTQPQCLVYPAPYNVAFEFTSLSLWTRTNVGTGANVYQISTISGQVVEFSRTGVRGALYVRNFTVNGINPLT